ncbi:hypothetical protein, partial [Bifidobacterium longum]|uniref:hypothetical protein n=1 Tax=Bifidobacterium longum TaxID=216816 RepID=UPI001E3F38D6
RRASPQRQRDCVRYVCNRAERLAKLSASSPSFPVRSHCSHMQSIPTTGADTAGLAGFLAKLTLDYPHNGTDMWTLIDSATPAEWLCNFAGIR